MEITIIDYEYYQGDNPGTCLKIVDGNTPILFAQQYMFNKRCIEAHYEFLRLMKEEEDRFILEKIISPQYYRTWLNTKEAREIKTITKNKPFIEIIRKAAEKVQKMYDDDPAFARQCKKKYNDLWKEIA